MARYTDDSKGRVRDAVEMVDLVGTRVELRRAGANRYEGLCPFYDECTPSFGINRAEKLFYCFGCGEGGDAFKFVQLTDGVDFKGALAFLADRSVIVAERYTEVIAMHQAGLRNTVGLVGTALTEQQVGELARLAPTVTLAVAADSAGQEAMLRAARVAAAHNLGLRVVPLPPGANPADLVQSEGAKAVQRRVDASVPFVRLRVERELDAGDLSTAEGKDRVIDALRPVFAGVPPGAMREELVALVADRTDLAAAPVAAWLAQPGRGRPASPSPAARRRASGRVPARPAGAATRDPAARAERAFLAQCVALPSAGREVLARLDLDRAFTSELTRRAAAHVRAHLEAPSADLPTGDDPLATLIAEIAVRAADTHASRPALECAALTLELLRLDHEISATRAAATGDVAPLVSRRQDLRARRARRARRDRAIARSRDGADPASRVTPTARTGSWRRRARSLEHPAPRRSHRHGSLRD